MRPIGVLNLLASIALASSACGAYAEPVCSQPALTNADFERYFSCFNARDYSCFTSFYSDDVVLSKGPKWPDLQGRKAIEDFYHDVDDHGLLEHAVVHRMAVGKTTAAVDLEARFKATRDWPDFGSRAVKQGDQWQLRGVLFYEIACGKIVDIRPAGRSTSAD